MPVVGLFLGTTKFEDAMAAARHKNPQVQRDQLCEVNFFVGHYALMAKQPKEAANYFRASLATKVAQFDEFRGARAELVKMGLKP
jgi:lipoprotein NlpI